MKLLAIVLIAVSGVVWVALAQDYAHATLTLKGRLECPPLDCNDGFFVVRTGAEAGDFYLMPKPGSDLFEALSAKVGQQITVTIK